MELAHFLLDIFELYALYSAKHIQGAQFVNDQGVAF